MPDLKNDPVMISLEVKNADIGSPKKDGSIKREFHILQAEGILAHEAKLGKKRHTLPQDSKFKVNNDGKIVEKSSK